MRQKKAMLFRYISLWDSTIFVVRCSIFTRKYAIKAKISEFNANYILMNMSESAEVANFSLVNLMKEKLAKSKHKEDSRPELSSKVYKKRIGKFEQTLLL